MQHRCDHFDSDTQRLGLTQTPLGVGLAPVTKAKVMPDDYPTRAPGHERAQELRARLSPQPLIERQLTKRIDTERFENVPALAEIGQPRRG